MRISFKKEKKNSQVFLSPCQYSYEQDFYFIPATENYRSSYENNVTRGMHFLKIE